jgi:hypothetical protein
MSVNSDYCFVSRPYIIVERGQPRVKRKHIQRLLRNEMTFDDFLVKGLVEYLVRKNVLLKTRPNIQHMLRDHFLRVTEKEELRKDASVLYLNILMP